MHQYESENDLSINAIFSSFYLILNKQNKPPRKLCLLMCLQAVFNDDVLDKQKTIKFLSFSPADRGKVSQFQIIFVQLLHL